MFPEGRFRTFDCLTYLASFENATNLSFFPHILFFLGRANEFKTLSVTSLFKAEQASPPQRPSITLESHSLAMWYRLSWTFPSFYLLYSLPHPRPTCLRMIFPVLMIQKINIVCGVLNLTGCFKIKLLIKLREPNFKGSRNSRK